LPPPEQHPQEPVPPSQGGASAVLPLAPAEANTDNFLDSFVEPQCGHLLPFQRLERTSTSLSRSQLPQ